MNERMTNTQTPIPVDTLDRTTGVPAPAVDSTGQSAFSPTPRSAEDSVELSGMDFTTTSTASVDTISQTTDTLPSSIASRSTLLGRPIDTHTQDTVPHSATDTLLRTTPLHIDPEIVIHERTDSLSTAVRHDRSQNFPSRTYCTADSSRSPFELFQTEHPYQARHAKRTIAQKQPASYHEASARAVYGMRSTLEPPFTEATPFRQMTDNSLFQGFVLMLAVTYVLLIYHNILDIRTLLNRVFHDQTSGERRFEDPGGSRYIRFMRTTTSIGILFIGILVVKYMQPIDLAIPLDRFLFVVALALSLAVSAVFLLVIGFQWILLRLVGALTLTQPLITQLQQLRKVYFSSAVVLIAPALFLFTLGPQQTQKLWLGLVVAGSAVTLFLYLRETLNLFLSKKISIIHWFLYLCSVELFPVSLLWQLAVR